jgi:hypothetical protein
MSERSITALLGVSLLLAACSHTSSVIELTTQQPVPDGETPPACAAALLEGTLVAVDGDLRVQDEQGTAWHVVWPYGYYAQQTDDGVRLYSPDEELAGEGDRVRIGGGEFGAAGQWRFCDSLTLLSGGT